MTESIKKVKVVIIGAGPAGLTAAIYCARANLEPVVAAGSLRDNLMPGGQLMTTTEVENYPGFPDGITGPELVEKMQQQAKKFGAEIIEEWATDCTFRSGETHSLRIGNQKYEADTVIIATGANAKWLGLPDEDKYKNNGVSACATCDGALPIFRRKHIYVVGGGDTAMEEATFLTRFASKVTIVHRRDKLRASKAMQDRAFANEKIEFMWDSVIVGYEGEEYLTGLKIKNLKTDETQSYPTPGLFMGIGHKPETGFLNETECELDSQGYLKTERNIYTNIEGVFGCGDVHDTHYRQAITAAGLGCMAAIAAERYLENK